MSKTDLERVVEGSYCMGCGACSYVAGYKMQLNSYGEFKPNLEKSVSSMIQKDAEFVCPSLNAANNEDVLADSFLKTNPNRNEKLGYYKSIYGAFVKEGSYREKATSGGFGTWIGVELLKKGLIDGVIHMKAAERENDHAAFYRYGISTTEGEIRQGSKTKYHVVEVSEVLNLIRNSGDKKYLFIGLPCIVKAIRRVQLIDETIKNAIPYTAALVCGHLKSVNWSLSLAWGNNIPPSELETLQYRTKGEQISIRSYCFTAFKKTAKQDGIIKDSADVIGGKFNQGALMLQACNYCDDLVGETADLTIGDAWLAKYELDRMGTNLLIVRNQTIDQLIQQASSENRLFVDQLTADEAIYAQAGGYRQRREGLSYRLSKLDKKGEWYPEKRIKPNQYTPTFLRKRIYDYRSLITDKSRIAFKEALEKSDYRIYSRSLKTDLKILRTLEVSSSMSRILRNRLTKFLIKTRLK